MYLVIAEKPSVSRSIAKVIGAEQKREGYLEGADCIVSWCLGHLAEYLPPDGYDEKYARWVYEDLPIIPGEWKLEITADKKEQFAVLKKLLNRPDIRYVVNACDAGREGELIFRRVYELSKSTIPVKRLWISSMEDAAIRDGMEHLKNGSEYQCLADAAVCRAKADWLVGMNATRAYTAKYFKRLTVGRVQTPTLAMLVDRMDEIAGFRKQKYYNVELDFDGMTAVKQKIFEEQDADHLQKICDGSEAAVISVTDTEKTVRPPKLYDLTTLQREANRIYGMTAQQTLVAAQSLYESKLITYPRTDSNYLTEDMEETAKRVIGIVYEKYQPLGPFEKLDPPDLRQVMNNKKVSDHHAIIPTAEMEQAELSSLNEQEQRILFLIAIHTLEAAGKSHLYTETEIEVECQGERFRAKEKKVMQPGWKIYEGCLKDSGSKEGDLSEKKMEKPFPQIKQGQKIRSVSARKSEHFTSPPKNYTEDTLLSAMETAGNKAFEEGTEKKGLGTPATRAGIIEKLVHSQYAYRKGRQILATEDGKALISILPDFLKSAGMTAEWENQLLEMERGEILPDQFLTGIQNMLTVMLNGCDQISEEDSRRFETRESIGTCPVCGSLVFEGKNNFYCSNRECRFALWKETKYLQNMRKKINKKMAAELLKSGKTHVKDLYSAKRDQFFEADLEMKTEGGKVLFSLSFPTGGQNKKSKHKK